MKPFNLEEAKNGKPVCNGKGESVRIICFDAKDENYPIIGLVTNSISGKENHFSYTTEGRYSTSAYTTEDLCMKVERRIGWINIYPDNQIGNQIYVSGETAKQWATDKCVATIKIEWEE